MSARTVSNRFYYVFLVALTAGVLLCALPSFAFASSQLVWGTVVEDDNTGEIISDDRIYMEDDGTYPVALNISKDVYVARIEGSASFDVSGILFRIPDPQSPRELIGAIGGFFGENTLSWEVPGVYELDVYNVPPPVQVNRGLYQRFLQFVLGDTVYAQSAEDYVETIRFTVTDESAVVGFSSVLFLPGIKGSILRSGSDTLWPPTAWSNDVPQLALNEAGESVNDVQVNGILDTFYGFPIYSPFSNFMDALVSEGLIEEWLPLAYDWRHSPEKVIDDGIKTSSGMVDVLEKIEQLATNSRSGKVTIVAHSMGGLLGKAIIKRLQQEGKDNLIDAFVMVGSPQLGTPQAISAILHGDGEGIASGFIVQPAAARTISQNMPSAYSLLPSPAYFSAVTDPVITFADVGFTQNWRNFWGNLINTYSPFVEFMTGQGVTRTSPPENFLHIPEVVRTDLMGGAADFHAMYDTYAFPEHIRVVQVAGWGRPTVKAVEYRTSHFLQSYGTLFTREGDSTVVYPSAISSVADETYFFNLDLYREPGNKQAQHRDLLSTSPIRSLIESVISGENILQTNFVLGAKPQVVDLDDELIVRTYSPVILGAYDEFGNLTGIDPNQDLSAEILTILGNIPGSSFIYTSETQHIFLPKTGTYTFVYQGVGSGSTTVTIEDFIADATTPVASFSDIPTTENTNATFEVVSTAPEETTIEVDVNGDNQIDRTISPDGTEPSLSELLVLIKEKILTLDIKDKLKQDLLKKVVGLEKKIEVKKQKNAKVLAKFKKKVSNQEVKGKITTADANEIVALVELLGAQSDSVALNADVLVQLKTKIISLNIKASLKNNLFKRVDRLENKQALTAALANLTTMISKKATNGKITDTDAQMLINILAQIENAL